MRFRPCIDIHNGKVKQIVGSTLRDKGDEAEENFSSTLGGDYYASLYKSHGLSGGHIIILNPEGSQFYEADVKTAADALNAYEGGLQIGGGMNDKNAARFLDMGASHVIVTSFVFKNGIINFDNLKSLERAVGRQHLVLDLSCRRRDGSYFIVTDRWQKFTDTVLDEKTISLLSQHCDEFLVHAVDVEGKADGIEEDIASLLGRYCDIPCTYAGGIHSYEDIALLDKLSEGRLDFTVGSALDIFGGSLSFERVCGFSSKN